MAKPTPPTRPKTPEECPVCGEAVPRGALACPECGADHRSGWREDATVYDGVDLPNGEGFDHDAFVREEFGGGASPLSKPRGIHPVWWITGVVLILAMVAIYVFGSRIL